MAPVEIAPGLRRWTAWHDEWRQHVGSVAVETADEVVVIDPLVPDENADEGVGRDRARQAGARARDGLLAYPEHRGGRGAHGRECLGDEPRPAAVARRAGTVDRPFRPGERLPAGIEAVPTARANEVVYVVPSPAAIVPGDVVLGAKDGPGLRLCPAGWLPDGVGLEDLGARCCRCSTARSSGCSSLTASPCSRMRTPSSVAYSTPSAA